MKPIKLEMEAFGSYLDKTVIDFDKFGAKGIFLINGDTASGKTTIFDGICFALYGRTSSTKNGRNPEMMRSDYAQADTKTCVSLLFENNGEQYHIERMPAYNREGYKTKTTNQVVLTMPDGRVFHNIAEVDGKSGDGGIVYELLGLTFEQFHQVSMLAQGEFRELLTLDTKNRTPVFRSIFQTKIFEAFQNELSSRYKQLVENENNSRNLVKEQIKQIQLDGTNDEILSQAVEYALKEFSQKGKDFYYISEKQLETVLCNLEDMVERDVDNVEKLEKVCAQLDNQKEEFVKSYNLGKEQNRSIETYRKCLLQKEELDGKKGQISLWETELQRHEQADKVLEQVFATDELAKKLEQEKSTAEQLRIDIQKLEEEAGVLKEKKRLADAKDIGGLQEEKAEIENQYRNISIEKIIVDDKKDKFYFEQQANQNQQKEEGKENAWWTKSMVDLLEEYRNYETQCNQMEVSKKKAIPSLTKQEKILVKKKEEVCACSLQEKEAQKVYEEKRKLNIESLSYRLAKQLAKGEPCPICGALEHPMPAAMPAEFVTEEEVDEAEQYWNNKKKELQKSMLEAEKIETAYDEEKKWMMHNITDDLISGNKMDNRLIELKTQIQVDKTAEELGILLDHIICVLNEKKADYGSCIYVQVQDKKQRVNELEFCIEEITKEQEFINREYQKKKSELDHDTGSLVILKQQVISDKGLLEEKRQQLQNVLQDVGMENQSQAEAYRLSEGDYKDKKDQIQLYGNQLISNETLLKEYARFGEMEAVDLQKLQENIDSILGQIEETKQNLIEPKRRSTLNESLMKQLKQYAKKYIALEKQVSQYRKLAETADGKTYKFETYILEVYFDKILEQANKRLGVMMKNQFELRRGEKKQGSRGLDIFIHDYRTGKLRDVKTLSGGESFVTSLAMAFGLSDIVQSKNSGTRIETMFIDEGFGTLDTEVLEQSIRILEEMAESNILIGIISHKEELKSRIDKKILVSKKNGKSKIAYEIQ